MSAIPSKSIPAMPKLRAKQLLLIVLSSGLFALGWLILSYWASQHSDTSNRGEQELSSLHALVEDQMLALEEWAESQDLLPLVEQQLRIPRDQEALLASHSLEMMRGLMNEKMKAQGFIGFFVIAPDYVNIASMRDSNVGDRNLISVEHQAILDSAFSGRSRFVPPIYSDVPLQDAYGVERKKSTSMFVASPIRDNSGEVIAILTGRIPTERDFFGPL